jgi:hypothetical protein
MKVIASRANESFNSSHTLTGVAKQPISWIPAPDQVEGKPARDRHFN